MPHFRRPPILLVLAALSLATTALNGAHPGYTQSDNPSRDATGKIYFERPIAHVMGHQGASWLERPEREEEENPTKLLELFELKSGQHIADIGVGSGYHTRRIAPIVGTSGQVYAVDIQPEMLTILKQNLDAEGITNVTPILGEIEDTNLPADQIDMAFMVDVYHECSHPYEMIQSICEALKPGGRLILVEYRKEDDWVPIKPLHKMTEAQARREMEPHPLKWVKTDSDSLPWQHVIVFEKTEPTPRSAK